MSESAEIHTAPTSFIRRHIFSTDHKVIGKQYLAIALFWMMVGALTIIFIRWQLAWPEAPLPGSDWLSEAFWDGESWIAESLPYGVVEPEFFNKMFTMHGTIMVFFVAMPLLLGAFGNFLVPLMIGARDMAFPRLNMMSVWTLALASVVLLASFVVEDGAAASGWTAYPPLSAVPTYSEVDWGQSLWIVAVALEFTSFLMGGINVLTTTINMRAPGLSWFRLPMMVWMQCTAAVLFMLSVGPLIAGAIHHAAVRSAGGHELFLAGREWGAFVVAASVLVLWAPRSLCHHVAGHGHRVGNLAGVLPQTDLWLSFDRVVDGGGRYAQLYRLGPPHVLERYGSRPGHAI